MTRDSENGTTSTRRSFLKSGTLLGLPLAAVAAPAVATADDELKIRLARLENEAAIREVHQTWLRSINTGAGETSVAVLAGSEVAGLDSAVRKIAADHEGQTDAIQVSADGENAVGRFHCLVEFESPIAQDCTIGQMAHAQGGGFVRRTERRVLKVKYAKSSSAWNIAEVECENTLS
jgi:hypothetical protein